MHVNKTKSTAHQVVRFDEAKDFFILRDHRRRQRMQRRKDLGSILEIPTRQLTDDKRMADDFSIFEQYLQAGIPLPQV